MKLYQVMYLTMYLVLYLGIYLVLYLMMYPALYLMPCQMLYLLLYLVFYLMEYPVLYLVLCQILCLMLYLVLYLVLCMMAYLVSYLVLCRLQLTHVSSYLVLMILPAHLLRIPLRVLSARTVVVVVAGGVGRVGCVQRTKWETRLATRSGTTKGWNLMEVRNTTRCQTCQEGVGPLKGSRGPNQDDLETMRYQALPDTGMNQKENGQPLRVAC